MRKMTSAIIVSCLAIVFAFQSCNAQNQSVNTTLFVDDENVTNNFFDNSEIVNLLYSKVIVGGEVSNPGEVDFSKLQLRDLIVKETVLDENGEDKFVGAYRYVGYSLADILNTFIVDKANAEAFPPLIDLYVEIENDKGEKVVVSWGEIYYPNSMHEIIFATGVSRIVPDKSKDMWTLPVESKMVFVNDLITARNISNPVKITVKSYANDEIEIIKGKKPLFSPDISIIVAGKTVKSYNAESDFSKSETLHTIFYGKGRGLHSTKPFTGLSMKEVMSNITVFNTISLQTGLVIVVADDGYRTVFTFSELSNRNDQSDVLLLCDPTLTDNGIFKLFPSCDFFSDRAIKGINRIYFISNNKIQDYE